MSAKVSDQRIALVCLAVITAVALGAALAWLRPVMIPFILALFLVYGVSPVLEVLTERVRLPRAVAVIVTLAVGFSLFTLITGMVSGSVKQLASEGPAYEARLRDLLADATQRLNGMGIDFGMAEFEKQVRGFATGSALGTVAQALLGIVGSATLVLIFSLFLLLGRPPNPPKPGSMRGTIEARIKRYILVKVGMSALTGSLVGFILWVIGLDLALVFGVLAFVLNFIPSVGSIVATLLPLPVAILSPDSTVVTVLLVLFLPGGVQLAIGNFLEPKILGESLELHPISILLGLIFWGMLWGIPGMLLAAPLTAILKIMLDDLPMTRPVGQLLAGRAFERTVVEVGTPAPWSAAAAEANPPAATSEAAASTDAEPSSS